MDAHLIRIIDANFNRSREALRVLEEYARFVLDDATATARLKAMRHELTAAVQRLAPDPELLAARNTAADVGTELTAPAELQRSDAAAVCAAAAARLAESLRALEEYGKVLDPQAAAAIESLRYRTYEIDQRLRLSTETRARLRRARLYVIVTESLCELNWLETVERVARAGAHAIQLREKDLPDAELLDRARAAAEVCRSHDTLFFVNDRPDVARLARADGLHVGQHDLPLTEARRIVGPRALVGLSTHNPQQLDAALALRPDYVAVGPMFPTQTKPQPHVPGPDLLALALQKTELPVVAIGGITPDSLTRLPADRPFCIATCTAVISRPDPAAAVTQFLHGTNDR